MNVRTHLEKLKEIAPPKSKRLTFRFPIETIDQLDKAARMHKATRTDILFACLNAGFKELEKK